MLIQVDLDVLLLDTLSVTKCWVTLVYYYKTGGRDVRKYSWFVLQREGPAQRWLPCVVYAEESNCGQNAKGPNSIKFIDYLLLHDNSSAWHYPTCPPSLLGWQLLRLRPQQPTDLLAPKNKWEQAPRGFQSSLQYSISSASLFQATDLSE